MDAEDAVVVAALQLLPSVQRRALALHYMGGVAVNDLATLSGSSAEHIESVLDDGSRRSPNRSNGQSRNAPTGATTTST